MKCVPFVPGVPSNVRAQCQQRKKSIGVRAKFTENTPQTLLRVASEATTYLRMPLQ
jgi:hypothetical protein